MSERLIDNYLTVEQAAEQLGLKIYRIKQMIRGNEIRSVKIGAKTMLKMEYLTEYLAAIESKPRYAARPGKYALKHL